MIYIYNIVLPGRLAQRGFFVVVKLLRISVIRSNISKCINNLFIVIERTDRSSLAVLVNYNVAHVCDQLC